jgi:hypothetical protein
MQTKHKMMIVADAGKGGAGVTKVFIERGYRVVVKSLNITACTFASTEGPTVIRGGLMTPQASVYTTQ